MEKLIEEVRLNFPFYQAILETDQLSGIFLLCDQYMRREPPTGKLTTLVEKTVKEIGSLYDSISASSLYEEYHGEPNPTKVLPSFKAIDNLEKFIKKRISKVNQEVEFSLIPLEEMRIGYFSRSQEKIGNSISFSYLVLSTTRTKGEEQCCDFEVELPPSTLVIEEGGWLLVPPSRYKVKKVKRDALKNFRVILRWETLEEDNFIKTT
jgi:hypothetical protein